MACHINILFLIYLSPNKILLPAIYRVALFGTPFALRRDKAKVDFGEMNGVVSTLIL